MDDMKKLVEKYKRELMEYSRTAAKPEKLSFPEMLPEEPEATPEPAAVRSAPPRAEVPAAEMPSASDEFSTDERPDLWSAPEDEPEQRKPRIVGYSDDQSALNSLEKYFADLGSSDRSEQSAQTEQLAPEAPQTEEQPYNELLAQSSPEAPQLDVTDNAVSPETNFVTEQEEPQQPEQFPRSGEVTAAEPGQIENLGEIPESGQSPEEQLGRRSFENQTPPRNSREDIKPLVQQQNDGFPQFPPEPEYADIDEFMKANQRLGTLRFRTYTARNALPVPNANIVVFKNIGGSKHIFYTLTTDKSGQTEIVTLPAPPSSLSQTPTSGIQPYALYDADITAEGFIPVSIRKLPLFEGILSVQRAAMVPSTGTESGETITEEEPNLTEVSDA